MLNDTALQYTSEQNRRTLDLCYKDVYGPERREIAFHQDLTENENLAIYKEVFLNFLKTIGFEYVEEVVFVKKGGEEF